MVIACVLFYSFHFVCVRWCKETEKRDSKWQVKLTMNQDKSLASWIAAAPISMYNVGYK